MIKDLTEVLVQVLPVLAYVFMIRLLISLVVSAFRGRE